MQNNLANKGSKSIQFALHVLIRRGTFMIRFETINNDGRVCGGSLCVFKEVNIQNWTIPLKIQNYIWALYYLLARKAMGKLKHNTTHSGSNVCTNKIAKVRTRTYEPRRSKQFRLTIFPSVILVGGKKNLFQTQNYKIITTHFVYVTTYSTRFWVLWRVCVLTKKSVY